MPKETLNDLAVRMKKIAAVTVMQNSELAEAIVTDQQRQDDIINGMRKETVNISLTVSQNGQASDIIGVTVTIRNRDNGDTLWTATWQGTTLTCELTAQYRYEIVFGMVSGYATPTSDKYNAVYGNSRTVTRQYIALSDAVDTFIIDDNVDNPATKISGTVNGPVMQWIRAHTHRYLMKKTSEGTAAICQLHDSNSNYFFDGETVAPLTGTAGDVIRKYPVFYWKSTEVSTHRHEVMIALANATGNLHQWDDRQVIGVYEGHVANGKLYSRSGVPSTGSVSQANFKSYARARGAGYTLEKWIQHCIDGLLFYAEHGNTQSQGIIGSGTNDYTKNTGQTDTLGMEDTVNGGNGSTGSINSMGKENAWGNKAEWIDNVVVDYNASGNIFKITEDDGTVRQVVTQVGTNAHVWPTKMILGEHFDLIASPDNVVGADSKGYCDGFYLSTSSSRVVSVSYNYSFSGGGVAYANANNDSSASSAGYGARLAFKGELTEYDDPQAFLDIVEVL